MNEHEQQDYAARMMRRLNAGLEGLDRNVVEALAAARRHALERGYGRDFGRLRYLAATYDIRFGMAAVALLAVMALTLLMGWPSQRPAAQEVGQLDIGLLTGELPPGAYIDEDFPAWRRLPGLCRS